MAQAKSPEVKLVRAIGRWALAALVFNSIVGSSIFGLPGNIAKLLGGRAPVAYIIAGLGIAVIVACFAQVSSYFSGSGGQILYCREAYGRFAGIWMGWMALLVRVTAVAAAANLLTTTVGRFWPPAAIDPTRMVVLACVIGLLALVNIVGVAAGARFSTLFAIAKIVPLLIFVLASLSPSDSSALPLSTAPSTHQQWFEAILLLVFAYGGFEAALVPMAEAKHPQRDAPIALFTALGACVVIYTAAQIAVDRILGASAAQSATPLADAAQILLGNPGAWLLHTGAVLSIYGYLSANLLNAPRMIYALAEQNDFPSIFARIHPRFRTPWISILVFALSVWVLAVIGSFAWNVYLSAITRLLGYGAVCAALFVFRKRNIKPEIRIPGAPFFAICGIVFCTALATRMGTREILLLLATALCALLTWLGTRSSS